MKMCSERRVVASGRGVSVAAVPGLGLWENAEGQAGRSYGLRARWCNWPPLRLARVRCERESVSVVLPAGLLHRGRAWRGCWVSRAIGMDVHRDFCVVAICEAGAARVAGRVVTSPEQLEVF